jgi:nucleoside phosphorylase
VAPGLAPTPFRPEPKPTTTTPLPRADVLIVTYHATEGHALADVLTPGWNLNHWYRYRNGWRNLKNAVQAEAPSLARDQAGRWATTRIGATTAVLVKSDLHPCTDGDQLPLQALWRQMLDQVRPRLVVSTGSAGALGPEVVTGDLIISRHVRWNATAGLGDQPWAQQSYASTAKLRPGQFTFAARNLLPTVSEHLPPDRARRLFTDTSRNRASVITTDFLAAAADRAALLPHLHSARAVEMADAVLGLVCAELEQPPAWISVRTAHDAQTDVSGRDEGRREAAAAHERVSYWATLSSAIACWSVAVATGHAAPSGPTS